MLYLIIYSSALRKRLHTITIYVYCYNVILIRSLFNAWLHFVYNRENCVNFQRIKTYIRVYLICKMISKKKNWNTEKARSINFEFLIVNSKINDKSFIQNNFNQSLSIIVVRFLIFFLIQVQRTGFSLYAIVNLFVIRISEIV